MKPPLVITHFPWLLLALTNITNWNIYCYMLTIPQRDAWQSWSYDSWITKKPRISWSARFICFWSKTLVFVVYVYDSTDSTLSIHITKRPWVGKRWNDHVPNNCQSASAIHCYGVPRTSLPHSGHLPIGPKGMPGTFQAHFYQLPIATCLLLTSPHDYSDTLTLPDFFHKRSLGVGKFPIWFVQDTNQKPGVYHHLPIFSPWWSDRLRWCTSATGLGGNRGYIWFSDRLTVS